MRSVSRQATRYDTTTIICHWLTAILIATQWLGAQIIDWFPRGPLRVDARSVHIVCGLLLAAILAFRLLWRATRGRRLPPADTGFPHIIAKAVQWSLYGLLIAMLLVGLALTWVRGDSIFNLFSIPSFAPGDKDLSEQIQDIHATIGWIILAIAGLHAAAALIHHFVWRDNVLGRMGPRHR